MSQPTNLTPVSRRSRRRELNASLRDSWLLFTQFRWPLLAFLAAMLGGGIAYFILAKRAGEEMPSVMAAIYQVLSMTFLSPIGDMPSAWYLEVFYFIMPLIGLIIVAQGVADFSFMLFNRRARRKEWEMAVATTFKNHIVVIGLGHLGFRVVQELVSMDQDVIVVELNPSARLVESAKELGVPVIEQDATQQSALEAAGIARARGIVLCTQNDGMNLQIAVKARSLNPKIHVTVRIFDDDFAQSLNDQFGFTAMSATGMAAPAFAASASGVEITRPITLEGHSLSLARFSVNPGNGIDGVSVGQIEKQYEVSVVLLRQEGENDLHPSSSRMLQSGDVLAILGGPRELNSVLSANTQPSKQTQSRKSTSAA
jgi:Trk K+ transport system NAD-binding subunit